MGHYNLPPCPKKRFSPKSVHLALGVLGATDLVPVYLEDFDVRYGWILKISIDRKGGIEVIPPLVQPLLYCILSSARSHDFLCSMVITQESSSGGGGEICHGLCGCEYATDMWARNEVS